LISSFDKKIIFLLINLNNTNIPIESINELAGKLEKNSNLLTRKMKYLVTGQIQSGKKLFYWINL